MDIKILSEVSEMKVDYKDYLKSHIVIISFIAIFAFVLIFEFILVRNDYNNKLSNIKEFSKNDITYIEDIGMENIELIYNDIYVMSKLSLVVDYLDLRDSTLYKDITSYFINYLDVKQVYDQLRILDIYGNEIIRVNYNDGNPNAVSENELQNKSHRYYFTEGMKVGIDDIYVSPLDLNIENKSIEIPYKPMIRFSKQLHSDDGKLLGLIVLNYCGDNFLYHFDMKKYEKLYNDFEIFLLNKDGYYLKATDPSKEWAFMFEEKHEISFKNDFKEEWATITTSDNGMIETDNGLFTYKNLSFDELEDDTLENTRHWRLVLHISDEKLHELLLETIRKYHHYNFYFVPVILLIAMMISIIITLNKKYSQALIDAKVEAESSNVLKSRFLANMSHEIRTPMHAIIGISFLALQEENKKTTEDYLLSIHNAANGLIRIINDILDYTKIEMNKLSIESVPFDLHLLVEALKSMFYIDKFSKNIHFRFNVDSAIPNRIKGDPGRLNQIFLNLLSNATKFTDEGFIELSCDVIELEENMISIRFKVSDTGIGMNDEMLERLYEEYEQADDSISRQYGGTGLGLSISNNLIKLMNGQMSVESELGLGTTFIFDLKFGLCNEDEENVEIHTAPHHDLGYTSQYVSKPILTVKADKTWKSKSFKSARILVIDDNIYNQIIISELLARLEFEVEVAMNGAEAIKMINDTKYDLVFMDVQMPIMNGYETTKLIRKDFPEDELPIIGMSANVMEEDQSRAKLCGMNSYLTKPIEVYSFYDEVAKHLDMKIDVSTSALKDRFDRINPMILDVDFGMKFFMDDIYKYQKTLTDVLKAYSNCSEVLHDYIQAHQYSSANKYVHELKGVSGNLGMVQLFNNLKEIQVAITTMSQETIFKSLESMDRNIKNVQTEVYKLQPNVQKLEEYSEMNYKTPKQWLINMVEALENHDAIIIKELMDFANQKQWHNVTNSLQGLVDIYEYDTATGEVKKLLKEYEDD